MSKVFYDHLTDLDKVERRIKKIAKTAEDREELYKIIDEILHHRMIGKILERLPKDHHKDFLNRFSKRPHDENLLVYLAERIKEDVEEFLRAEAHALTVELLLIVEGKLRKKK